MFESAPSDPIQLFAQWQKQAKETPQINEPTAASLATVDACNTPSNRMILVKSCNQDGFVFYTNLNSPKAQNIAQNPMVSLCFYWDFLGKQIRIQGIAKHIADQQADDYFASRSYISQVSATLSQQSQPLASTTMKDLQESVQKAMNPPNTTVKRPKHWSGFCVQPRVIEFWHAAEGRLHHRLCYTHTHTGWKTKNLYP